MPDNNLSQLLLKELGSPIISISAKLPDGDEDTTMDEIFDALAPQVDIAIQIEDYTFKGESTVIDMTTDEFSIMREGAGLDKVLRFFEFEEE